MKYEFAPGLEASKRRRGDGFELCEFIRLSSFDQLMVLFELLFTRASRTNEKLEILNFFEVDKLKAFHMTATI